MIYYWTKYLFCFRFAFITQTNIDQKSHFFFDYYLLIDKVEISDILIRRINSIHLYTIEPRRTFFSTVIDQ